MGISCQINLFKPSKSIFQPGEVVSGIIKYILPEQMEFERVLTSLKGNAELEIRMPARNFYNSGENIFSSKETYVDIDHIVTDQKTKVPAGTYDVHFYFTLPQTLPSTIFYEEIMNQYKIFYRIKYYIRIKFERPGWFKFSKHFRKEISVVSGITPHLLMQPIVYGTCKKLLRLFSRKNALITIKATIQNSVIPIGGQILINYEIKNDTDVVITDIDIKLIEIYTFKVQGHSKIETCCGVPGTGANMGRIDSGTLKPLFVEIIVPLDRSTLQNSKLVKRNYVVRIVVILPMPHRNIVLDVPVQIGTINNYISENIPKELCVTQSTVPVAYWEVMNDVPSTYLRS